MNATRRRAGRAIRTRRKHLWRAAYVLASLGLTNAETFQIHYAAAIVKDTSRNHRRTIRQRRGIRRLDSARKNHQP